MPPTEEQLRERIHRLFAPDGCCGTRERPAFWAPPPAAGNGESITLRAVGMTEEEWLQEPNPAFDGRSPNEVLGGCPSDREKLENAIRAVEEGAFS